MVRIRTRRGRIAIAIACAGAHEVLVASSRRWALLHEDLKADPICAALAAAIGAG